MREDLRLTGMGAFGTVVADEANRRPAKVAERCMTVRRLMMNAGYGSYLISSKGDSVEDRIGSRVMRLPTDQEAFSRLPIRTVEVDISSLCFATVMPSDANRRIKLRFCDKIHSV